ncbi:hypothetical protein ACH4E8_28885 [Streptomyces sp. NPDC017979]|uniref:hypothetical protein n=1 Tax=Streptomyces sp. NPDC017979 TaxID=3365024 RepID=UPI00379AD63D
MTEASVRRRRRPLRALAVTAVVVGAVLVPAGAAFADEKPKPVQDKATKCMPFEESRAAAVKPADKATMCIDLVKDKDGTPRATVLPRGGVAAGERPVTEAGTSGGAGAGTVVAASAAGTVLLAGAAVFVRRRGAARADATS